MTRTNRLRTVQVRFTDAEFDIIEEAAQKASLTISALIRTSTLPRAKEIRLHDIDMRAGGLILVKQTGEPTE